MILKSSKKKNLFFFIFIFLLASIPFFKVEASALHWSAAGAGYFEMSDPGDWTENVTPSPGDDLYFDANSQNWPNVDQDLGNGFLINSMNFSGAQWYDIGGFQAAPNDAITINNGITINSTAQVALGFTGITLNSTQTFSTNAQFTVFSPVYLNGNDLTIDTAGPSGSYNAGALPANNVIQGTGNLIKNGTGLAYFYPASTYTGTTTLNGGETNIYNNNSLSTGNITVNNGATLNLYNAVINLPNNITINGNGNDGNGALRDRVNYSSIPFSTNKNLNSFDGNITLGSDSSIQSNYKLTLNGNISGSSNLTLKGREVLKGTDTLTGNTILGDASNGVDAEFDGNHSGSNITFNTSRYILVSGTGSVGAFLPTSYNYTVEPGSIYGSYVGALTFNGNFVAPSGSLGWAELGLEMDGATPITQYSQINVNGTVDLSGDLYIDPYLGYDPIVGTSFTVINNDGSDPIIGQIEDPINDAKIPEGGTFTDYYDENYTLTYQGGDGNDLVLTTTGYTTVTTLNANSAATQVGNNVTFTAHVVGYGASVNGDTVSFLEGSTVLGTGTIVSGNATFMTNSLPVGVHHITARHEASTVNGTSTSSIYDETIFVPVSGHQITNLPSNLDTLDVNGNSVKQGSIYSLNDPNDPVSLVKTSGVRIADTIVNMTADRNWSTVTGDADTSTGKSYAHNLNGAPGANSTFDLYVPQLGSNNGVRICPSATSLATVTTSCTGGYEVSSNNANVTSVNIGGQNYLVIHGVTNGGGLSVAVNVQDSGLSTILGQWDPTNDVSMSNGVSIENQGLNHATEDLRTMSDGTGGNYIVWSDNRNGTGATLYAQRVNSSGNALWTSGGINVCTGCIDLYAPQDTTIATDGAGGIIVTWADQRISNTNINIYAQRIDSNGNILWGSGGLQVRNGANNAYRPIAVAGNGGTYIFWLDDRIGSGADQVYGQFINSAGVPQWTANGILVSSASGQIAFRGFVASSDGAGNAFVIWEDNFNLPYGFHMQKYDSSGTALWSGTHDVSSLSPEWAQMIPDGSGGAFLEWDNIQYNPQPVGTLHAQHVDSSGNALWTSDGVQVSTNTSDNASTSNAYYYSGDDRDIVADGSGGVYLSWVLYNTGATYVQRLDSTGAKQWGANGIVLGNGLQYNLQSVTIVSDGSGGIYVAYLDTSDFGFYGIYLQKFNQAGTAYYNPGCVGDPNGYFAMKTYGEPIYLNTGSSPSDVFLTTSSYAQSNGWNLYVQKFNESTHGYQVKGLPSDLDAIDINGNSVKEGSVYGLACINQSIRLKKISNNSPIADIESINFRYKPVWSGVASDNDLAQKKTFFGNITSFVNEGINCFYTCNDTPYNLYVPKVANDSNAHICPTATNLSTVTNSCTSGTTNFNAASTTINSQQYWMIPSVVSGLSENTSGPATVLKVVPSTLVTNVSSPFNLTITAKDSNGYTSTNYTGTVQFSSTAGVNGNMPGNYPFVGGDNGSHTFSNVSFSTTGNFTITSTDNVTPSITGTSDGIQVGAALQNSSTNLQSSLNPSNSGDNVTFTATVTGGAGTATGTVTFKDNGTTIGSGLLNASGVATFSTTALSVATHPITAVYGGDTTYNPSTSNTVNQVVNSGSSLQNSSTNLQSSLNPSYTGNNVTFTATVTGGSGTPTGTVTFKDNGTTIGSGNLNGSGIATYSTSSLSIATHPITAVYGGDGTYNGSTSNTVNQIVNSLISTATNLQSNLNPSNYGDNVTFAATVTGGATPTGTVTFFDGVTQIGSPVALNGSGIAQYSTSTLSVTSHSISAAYNGDSSHSTNTSNTVNQVVNKVNTSTNLISSLNPSYFGNNVTFTATVTGGSTPTGTVTFYNGVTPIGPAMSLNGSRVASISTTSLTVATHSITATYNGDGNHNSSNSNTVSQVVNPLINTTTNLVSDINPSYEHQNVTFSATVSGGATPTGSVTFKDGVTVIGSGNLNGSRVATFSTSSLSVGSHSISSTYNGDSSHNTSSSNTVIQVVNAQTATSTNLTSNPNPSNEGDGVLFTATITGGSPTGSVTFYDGSYNMGTSNLSGNVATITLYLYGAGYHSMTATYNGNVPDAPSTSNVVTQQVIGAPPPPPPPPKNDVQSITLTSSESNGTAGDLITLTLVITNPSTSPVATGVVTYYDGTTVIGTSSLGSTGKSTLTTSSLSVGTHNIYAKYAGDSNYNSATSNTKTITINNKIVPQQNPVSSPTQNQTTVPVNETSSSNENTQGNGGDFFTGLNQAILNIQNNSDPGTQRSLNAQTSLAPYFPGTVAGSAALFAASSLILASESSSAGLGILGIFAGIFIPRKKRFWGIVYDENTNKGIPFVTINLKDSQNNLVGTTVSDLDGKFKLASQGGEILEVRVSGYQPKIQRITSDMVEEGNVVATIGMSQTNAGFNINSLFHQLGSLIGTYLSKITLILTVIGLAINLYAVILNSNIYNILLLSFYAVVVALIIVKEITERFRSKGLVYDNHGRLIGGASVRIYDLNGVQLEVELSNNRGEIRFKIGEGKYLMKVSKTGYQTTDNSNQLQPVEILKGGSLNTNITLKGDTGLPPHTQKSEVRSQKSATNYKPQTSNLLDNPFTPKNFAIE